MKTIVIYLLGATIIFVVCKNKSSPYENDLGVQKLKNREIIDL